jgi:hypothetical protein
VVPFLVYVHPGPHRAFWMVFFAVHLRRRQREQSEGRREHAFGVKLRITCATLVVFRSYTPNLFLLVKVEFIIDALVLVEVVVLTSRSVGKQDQ